MKKNRDRAELWFIAHGLMPAKEDRTEKWDLHHVDPTLKSRDRKRYDEWRVEDLIPMTHADHARLHAYSRTGENHPLYGHKFTEEQIEKIRQTKIGKCLSTETKSKISKALTTKSHMCKRVRCIETGECFPSIRALIFHLYDLGFTGSECFIGRKINAVLKGELASFCGLSFELME